MATLNVTINPSEGWVVVFSATSETRVSVEKINGGAPASLAIDVAAPVIDTGHSLKSLETKTAVLFAGEKLYARCSDDLMPVVLAITG